MNYQKQGTKTKIKWYRDSYQMNKGESFKSNATYVIN